MSDGRGRRVEQVMLFPISWLLLGLLFGLWFSAVFGSDWTLPGLLVGALIHFGLTYLVGRINERR